LRSLLAAAVCCLAVPVFLTFSTPAPAQAASHAELSTAMVAKINQVRGRYGLRPLHVSPSLMRSSQRFSSDLLHANAFGHRSHVSANGRFSRLGEALAMHNGSRAGIARTVRAWLNSPPHRREVLTSSMSLVGTGMARGRWRHGRAVIWVLQVGKR
jgi:uncharacterized protein YkwD